MKIKDIRIESIKPYENNPRDNSKAVQYVKKSILQFGFKVPLVVTSDNVIVCGHTRYEAARSIGMDTVPCIIADDLTPEQIKAFRIIDNKSQEQASWDFSLLDKELKELSEMSLDFNLEDFSLYQIDMNASGQGIDFDLESVLGNSSDEKKESSKKPKCTKCPECGFEFEI